jgi:hypothetical protein
MNFEHIIPIHDLIDRTGFTNYSFNLTKKMLNFPVDPRMFHGDNDVLDSVLIKDSPKG